MTGEGVCPQGLLAVLRDEFRVLSNVESGEGRFDIVLKTLVDLFPAFIIVVKRADSPDADSSATSLRAASRCGRRRSFLRPDLIESEIVSPLFALYARLKKGERKGEY